MREAAADCVLFLAGAENDVPGSIDDICMLLASGKNVITTAANFIYPKSLGPEVEAAISRACEQGQSTFHGLGVLPGFFADSLPLLLSPLPRRVARTLAPQPMSDEQNPT